MQYHDGGQLIPNARYPYKEMTSLHINDEPVEYLQREFQVELGMAKVCVSILGGAGLALPIMVTIIRLDFYRLRT